MTDVVPSTRLFRSGRIRPQRDGARWAVIKSEWPSASARLWRWKSATSAWGWPAITGTSSTAMLPEASIGMSSRCRAEAGTIWACASAAQTWARWVLPAPEGPMSASLREGQLRQPSTSATAWALAGETKKSSRPSAVRAGRSKESWRGISSGPPRVRRDRHTRPRGVRRCRDRGGFRGSGPRRTG